MKLLTFQPYSLYAAGGGSRILRRLFEGRETEVQSVVVSGYRSPYKGAIAETLVYANPVHRPWMRSFIRTWSIFLRNKVFAKQTENKILRTLRQHHFDVLHIVNHGSLSAIPCIHSTFSGKLLWVSFHDHFNSIGSSFEQARLLWHTANRRLVISSELGDEYSRLFGNKPYEVITDGVAADEITGCEAIKDLKNEIAVYFAGLLHLDYLPLFKVLADALDILSTNGYEVELILRGTQKLDFLSNRKFAVHYKPLTVDNKALKQELDSADILYLPMKFTVPEFYLYSLSTKMVGYLGAPGAILYHGPNDSAACKLLVQNNAAGICENLQVTDLVEKIIATVTNRVSLSNNAKTVAASYFNIEKIRDRFWQKG